MTCIVGVIEKKKVYIGGDSAGVSGLDVTIRKDTKVFKVGDFVIGCTSSFRMIQLIRFSFSPPKMHDGDDVYRYMCTQFVDALRSCFKTGGFAEKSNDVESGGTFLVGYKGRLFQIFDDYQVGESIHEHDSCGCGQKYALGALAAMNKKLPAEERIRKALEISAHHSGGVRPPFIIESI
jgi:ATP-dependent protease HslVU (ClpYQ) peptidase subunit